jgi:signal transduction histidine kinase
VDTGIFERVLEITRQMAETRALNPLLAYAVQEAMALVHAERGFIVLIGNDGQFDFRVMLDADGNKLEDAEDQVSQSILRLTLEENEPQVILDAMSDPRLKEASSVLHLRLRSVICVPLIAHGRTLGALYVENRTARGVFTDQALNVAKLFANQAAVAIENAMLNDELEARVAARTVDLRRALANLETNWHEALEENESRIEMLGSITHDLRAPMAMAYTALELIRDGTFGGLSAGQEEWLEKSTDAINYAIDLIETVFDLSKIDMERFQLDLELTDLRGFLTEIHSAGLALPWSPGVTLRLELPDELPVVRLEPTQIRRVIFNLFSNTIKFTREGSITLYARLYPEEHAVLIGVRDTGEGVPAKALNRMFERFQQADKDISRRKKGLGLGLAIAREIVVLHGGRIWAESAPGQGADFKFTLPLSEA